MTGTNWSRFRVDQISLPTFLKRSLIHAELIAAVRRRAAGGALEVGVGSGAHSAALSHLVGCIVAVDNDARIREAARPNLDRFGRSVRLLAADAFTLPFRSEAFGVGYSQGLMEHFTDAEIGALLQEQLRVCRSVVFSVPSDRYPRQDVGDERLMDPPAWARIAANAIQPNLHRVAARYYRFDPESVKYAALAGRRLGRFSVLVSIDPR